jgi:hypothetical protein
MKKLTRAHAHIYVLVLLAIISSVGFASSLLQEKKPIPVCKKEIFAALKPLPKLGYRCGDQSNDYDEKILKRPDRVRAIKALERKLELFTSPAWWQASVDDLNMCHLRGKPGAFNAEEQAKLKDGDYVLDLFGDNRIRLVVISDPCYQTEYNGSNGFLLYRHAGKVFVTLVLDGYFSRADNSVNLDFANLDAEQIIEVSTGTGGLHPELTNYYFVIDRKTNRAVAKNLFQGAKGPSNEITSALLMSEPEGVNLPADAGTLNIIRNKKLAPSFSIYAEDDEGKIDDNGRKLTRTVLRWNGRSYQ